MPDWFPNDFKLIWLDSRDWGSLIDWIVFFTDAADGSDELSDEEVLLESVIVVEHMTFDSIGCNSSKGEEENICKLD